MVFSTNSMEKQDINMQKKPRQTLAAAVAV